MIASPRRYDSCGRGPPIGQASSASRTCRASRSASEYTATVPTPSRRHVRTTRQAISPRLAISTFMNILFSARDKHGWTRIRQKTSGLVHAPSELWPLAEVDQQADLDSGGFEVVHQPGLVQGQQCARALDFDEELASDQQVHPEFTYHVALVADDDRMLPFHRQSAPGEVKRKGSLLDGLQEPEAKRPGSGRERRR